MTVGNETILLYTTELTPQLTSFLDDDYNFECCLRLLNNLVLSVKIQSINDKHQRYKSLIFNLFTRYILNKSLKHESFNEVEFHYNEYGKPGLDNFEFNSSSSNDIIALAISRSLIGIDLSHSQQDSISSVDYLTQFDPIFTSLEKSQIDTYFKFNHFWTLKESFTKLIGSGLNIDLASFEFEVHERFKENCSKKVLSKSNDLTRFQLNWFDKISIKTDKISHHDLYRKLPSDKFHFYSSILSCGRIDKLPVIVSIVTQEIKDIECFEIDFLKTLQMYV